MHQTYLTTLQHRSSPTSPTSLRASSPLPAGETYTCPCRPAQTARWCTANGSAWSRSPAAASFPPLHNSSRRGSNSRGSSRACWWCRPCHPSCCRCRCLACHHTIWCWGIRKFFDNTLVHQAAIGGTQCLPLTRQLHQFPHSGSQNPGVVGPLLAVLV